MEKMNYNIEIVNDLPSEVESQMKSGFEEYESGCGITVNYRRFSLMLSQEVNDFCNVIGVLNGYTAFSEVYIDDLWVDKDHRKQGCGRKLVEFLEDHYSGKGFNNINLVTSVFQAPEFYKKCGFTVEFIRENKINPQFTKTFFVKFFKDTVQTQGLLNTAI